MNITSILKQIIKNVKKEAFMPNMDKLEDDKHYPP